MSASTPVIDLPKLKPIGDEIGPSDAVERFADRLVRHPHLVWRIGGEPIDVLDTLRTTDAAAAVDRLAVLEIERVAATDRACAAIEAAVPTVAASHEQRSLIRLKRDLYNGRPTRTEIIDTTRPLLDTMTAAAVETAAASIFRCRDAETLIAAAYELDTIASGAALRAAAKRHNLRAALEASSVTLFQALRKVEASAALRRKDWINLHLALAGFLTRATLKTSPRSSLTFVALGTWTAAGTADLAIDIEHPVLAHEVRIRHSVLQRIILPILADAGKLGDNAPIAANPTLHIVEHVAEWQRIAYSEDAQMETYGIISTTNRLHLQPALLGALTELASRPPQTLGEALSVLRARFSAADPDVANRLIQRFLALDLLVLNDVWPAQRDLLEWAASIVRHVKPELADIISTGVQRLEHAQQAIADAGPQSGTKHAIEREIDELADRLDVPVRAENVKPVFYEDCKIAAPSIAMRDEAIPVLQDDLPRLLRLLPLLRGYGWTGAWLTTRFVEMFGEGGHCEDPIGFLNGTAEALAASNGGSPTAPPWQSRSVPNDADALAQDIVSAGFADALRDHNRGGGDWTVPSPLVDHFYNKLPSSYRRRARSHCVNGQFASFAESTQFILNSVYPGNGRMTSRFLESGEAVAAYVGRFAPGTPIAIPGVFGFNANIHPQLSAQELIIPPYLADFEATSKIPLADCTLRHNRSLNQIVLEGPDSDRLSPFYFGILNSWALPPIHRAVDWLNGATDLPFAIPDAIFARDRPTDAPAVWKRPRLVMGTIVLGRRSWSVANTALPDSTLDDVAFFRALREAWRKLEMPRTVFFQASNVWRTKGSTALRPSKTRKPMYLDIDNVWLVKVFARALRSIAGHVVFTECLPEPGDTPVRIAGRPHAAEITIEIGLREDDV